MSTAATASLCQKDGGHSELTYFPAFSPSSTNGASAWSCSVNLCSSDAVSRLRSASQLSAESRDLFRRHRMAPSRERTAVQQVGLRAMHRAILDEGPKLINRRRPCRSVGPETAQSPHYDCGRSPPSIRRGRSRRVPAASPPSWLRMKRVSKQNICDRIDLPPAGDENQPHVRINTGSRFVGASHRSLVFHGQWGRRIVAHAASGARGRRSMARTTSPSSK